MSDEKNIDKENVILKYEKDLTDDNENKLNDLKEANDLQEEKLNDLKNRLSNLAKENDVKLTDKVKEKFKVLVNNKKDKNTNDENEESDNIDFEELFKLAENNLIERGLSPEDLDFNDLVSKEEFDEITKQLNEGLPREDKWTKNDFIITFTAAMLGVVCDLLLSDRNNEIIGKDSWFSEQLNKLHKHRDGSPIDYNGKDFGGGYHRVLSGGHDLLNPLEGIKQIKDGKFEGYIFENGVKIKKVFDANRIGTPFDSCSFFEAIVRYYEHLFGDVFSTYSLPIPGYSFLNKCNNRNVRTIVAVMYQNGFNIKNIATQSLSAICIEAMIRIYDAIEKRNNIPEDVEINEGYENIEDINRYVDPKHKEKLHEMLLVAHAIVTLENTGKIAIKSYIATKNINPKEKYKKLAKCFSEVNIAEIIATCKYASDVVKNTAKRNSEYAKLLYHADTIECSWREIDEMLCLE